METGPAQTTRERGVRPTKTEAMTMGLFELIAARPLVWGLFAVYLVLTSYLAWMGHKRTGDIKSYAVGGGDMNPIVVGITLAASIASTATFVINPGFVYVHGISALLHFGVFAAAGIIVGLWSMSFRFRRIGATTNALTLPHWMGERFKSRHLRTFFAGVNLLSLSFVVLILGGVSIVMQQTLGLSNEASLILVVVVVFGYVLVGGTYAHAYTNTLQGALMTVIALVIVGSGIAHFDEGWSGIVAALNAQDPNLTKTVNPASPLFGSFFSVGIAGFCIGFALVCQPHILTKALYVRSDAAVRKYLIVTVVVSLVFSALLFVGIYARLEAIEPTLLLDPATGQFSQDRVMAVYLAQTFDSGWLAVIAVALLAAGMSTLDGILVALSTIAASDLADPVLRKMEKSPLTEEARAKRAHRASQVILILMGLSALALAWSPPRLLGIFGQLGVYGIAASAAVPLTVALYVPRFGARGAAAAAVTGLVVHLGMYGLGQLDTELAVAYTLFNPAVTATFGILASLVVALPFALWGRAIPNAPGSSKPEIAPGEPATVASS